MGITQIRSEGFKIISIHFGLVEFALTLRKIGGFELLGEMGISFLKMAEAPVTLADMIL